YFYLLSLHDALPIFLLALQLCGSKRDLFANELVETALLDLFGALVESPVNRLLQIGELDRFHQVIGRAGGKNLCRRRCVVDGGRSEEHTSELQSPYD